MSLKVFWAQNGPPGAAGSPRLGARTELGMCVCKLKTEEGLARGREGEGAGWTLASGAELRKGRE